MSSTLRYTQRDFESIRQQLVEFIPGITDRWTDFSQSDPGIALLELWAAIGAQLGFYLDQSAQEAFLPTARQRRNVINLCKLIAYKLSHVTSSTSVVEFSLPGAYPTRVEIPKWTQLATQGGEPIYFATTEYAAIPAGDTTVQVGVRQGRAATETFTTSGVASQTLLLSEKMVDTLSVEVIIDGVLWRQVDSFVNAQADDRVYMVDVDHNSEVRITLPDGFFGYKPGRSNTPNASVRYLVSDGVDGNLGINVVKVIIDDITDSGGVPVSVSATNVQAATGGADQETIEHARKQAPAELSALFRAMTKGDFIALSEGFPGVGKANCWGEQESGPPNYDLFNWVMIVVSPEEVTREALLDDPVNNGKLSDQLKTDLFKFLEERRTITTRVKFLDPVYVPIDLKATLYYEKGVLPSVVKAGAEEAILDAFSMDNAVFGKEVRKSNVYRILDSVDGVAWVTLTEFSSDEPDTIVESVTLKNYELPYLRTLTLTMERAQDVPAIATSYPCPPEVPIPVD